MRPINYWITFTARDDKYREVLAVRMALSPSDDYRSTRAEIPAFGIVAEGDPREMHATSTDARVRRFFDREARLPVAGECAPPQQEARQ